LIISHSHRFIFIKTRKTAGTSLEIALSKFLGTEDVATPISPADEALRRELGFVGAQNHEEMVETRRRKSGWLQAFAPRHRPIERKRLFYNHMPAAEIAERVAPEAWTGYRKVSIERNSWDLAVSLYFWRTKARGIDQMSFADFIAKGLAYRRSKYDTYSINGLPVTDRMLRFETLVADASALGRELGLPEDLGAIVDGIKAKSGFRPARNYRELYDDRTREIIALQFAREIRLMGYAF
jgi:hypothetical protein